MKSCLKHLFLAAACAGLMSVSAQTFTNLYSFTSPIYNSDGRLPDAGLVLSGNILYGTALAGGSSGWGTIFAINLNGNSFTNLHIFTNGVYGSPSEPYAGLILSGNALYGTASDGAANGATGYYGTVFKVNTDGSSFTNLHTFANSTDEAYPDASLVLSGATLYGTADGAINPGYQSGNSSAGYGTVFAVNVNGTGFTNLHAFTATGAAYPYTNRDGAFPCASLVLSGSTVYGTASSGGTAGWGTLFAVNTDGTGFTNLHSFTYGNDGAIPMAGVVLSGNILYGTASSGGSAGWGTVFAFNLGNGVLTTVHSFTNSVGGAQPFGGLVLSGNTLYGTTTLGGVAGNGMIFKVNTDGSGFASLYSFSALSSTPPFTNSDGRYPEDTLILSGSILYGTANDGGSGGNGTVFALTLADVNVAPTLPVIPTQTVNELTQLTVTNTATESDTNTTTTGYTLVNPPAGMSTSSGGIITWTPSQTQSPATNTITTIVTNSDSLDSINPHLTSTNSFTVVVKEVNTAPTLPVIPTQTINAQALLTVTNTAGEANIHSALGYALAAPPTGMTISANGIISWTPTSAQAPSSNVITTVVTATNVYDAIDPRLNATNTFTVIVNGLLQTSTFTLGTSTLLVGPAGGTNSVVLAVSPPNAFWTATANASWLHLAIQFQSGICSSNVLFTSDANPGATRSGTLTIAGQTLTVTQAGSTYVAAGVLTTLVSSGLNEPLGVAVDASGNVYIADTYNNAIKKWTAVSNTVTTLVSSGLFSPFGVAVDSSANAYVANGDYVNEWIAATGMFNILFAWDTAYCVALDRAGNVYVGDANNGQVEMWTATNSTLSPLITSGLHSPYGVAVDAAGNVYVADVYNGAIQKWTPASSNLTTLVSITSAASVAVDGSGNVYAGNYNSIKMWTAASNSLATLISLPYQGDAEPGVAVDGSGNVYVVDNNLVQELPCAFVDPTAKSESAAAGSDALPVVLPATENLGGPFAPTSDQPWLSITSTNSGVVGFSFAANAGPSRTAHIGLFGQSIAVTQAGVSPPPALGMALAQVPGLTTNATGIFVLTSTASVGNGPESVAAFVDASGRVDLACVNAADNTLSILTNNGNGMFGSNATLKISGGSFSGPYSVAAGDLNGDGHADLISANGNQNTLSVFTNNGNGVFGSNATLNVGNFPDSVIAADVNRDGKLDLICANEAANGSLSVFTNNGTGSFTFAANYSEGEYLSSVTAADLKGSGNMDLVCAEYNDSRAGELFVLTNNGSGVFTLAGVYGTGGQPKSVVAVDVNGDGRPDLITANYFNNGGTGSVSVLINNGNGTFAGAVNYPAGNGTISLAAFTNGYGRVDLACANAGDNTLSIMTNNGSGGFATSATPGVGGSPGFVTVANVTGNGVPGLIAANQTLNTLAVFTQSVIVRTNLVSGLVISWPSSATGYVLEQNNSLGSTNWINYPGPVGSNGTTMSATNSTQGAPQRFYRLSHP